MKGERPSPRDKSIQVDLHPASTTAEDGTQLQGVGLTIQDDTSLNIFFHSITVQNGDFSLYIQGTPQGMQIEEQGFRIESHHDEAISMLRVNKDGRILFEYDPRPHEPKQQAVEQIKPQASPAARLGFYSNKELFPGVTIENPSTFEPLTFGQTLRYFRVDSKLSQRALGARAKCDESTIARFETGSRQVRTFAILPQLIQAFGWEEDDPRAQVLKSKFIEEASKRKS